MQTFDVALGDEVVRVRRVGSGPVLLFVHGALVDGHLWDAVAAALSDRFTCVIPDLPLGSHALPLPDRADRSPAGHARRLARLVDAMSLREVTLVGNDTGGVLCQLVAADHPEHVRGLVLTNCDALEVFPPRAFAYLAWMAQRPWAMAVLVRLLNAVPRLARMHNAYGGLAKTPIDEAMLRGWLRPGLDASVRADVAGFFAGIDPRVTLGVAERLRGFRGPVTLAWGTADPFFKLSLAERLAYRMPHAQIVTFDAATYVPLDQPLLLARTIAQHAAPARATMTA